MTTDSRTASLRALGASEPAARQLVTTVDRVTGPAVIVVQGPVDADASELVRQAAQQTFTDPAAALADVHLACPSADRWTVDEVVSQVIAPSQLKAYEQSHIVIASADSMSAALHDRLLKTVEEPSSAAIFWFCVQSASAVPATLRGRAVTELVLPPAPVEDLTAQLLADGLDPDQARRAVEAIGADLTSARACHAFDLMDLLDQAGAITWKSDSPGRDADHAILTWAQLARARAAYLATSTPGSRRGKKAPATPTQRGTLARLDTKKLTPTERAFVRSQLRRALTRWKAELTQAVTHVDTLTQMDSLSHRLRAVREAQEALTFNTPLTSVLTATLYRMNAPHAR